MNKDTFNKLYSQVDIIEQEPQLLYELINIVESIKPEVVVEIGIKKGGTLNFWNYIVPENGLIIGIDIKQQIESNHFNNNKIKFIEGNSLNNGTYQKFLSYLQDKEIDFLFIDGGHTYHEAKSDFYTFGWHVRKNGLIAFHDTMLDSEGYEKGSTKQFWEEIRNKKRKYWNIIYEKPDIHTGLGILRMNWL